MKLTSLGLAAGLLVAGGLAVPQDEVPAPGRARGPDLVDTLVLLRWGHGALDWLTPDSQGDAHVREPRNRD
jgi:hypothetical protein